MTSRDFCYWLQGYFEIVSAGDGERSTSKPEMDAERVACVRRHLAMVFKHEIDPSFGDKKAQDILTQIHQGSIDGAKFNC